MPEKTPTPDDLSAILEKASPLNTNQILKLRDYADKLQTEEQQEDKEKQRWDDSYNYGRNLFGNYAKRAKHKV